MYSFYIIGNVNAIEACFYSFIIFCPHILQKETRLCVPTGQRKQEAFINILLLFPIGTCTRTRLFCPKKINDLLGNMNPSKNRTTTQICSNYCSDKTGKVKVTCIIWYQYTFSINRRKHVFPAYEIEHHIF